jgi:hypothetical protein
MYTFSVSVNAFLLNFRYCVTSRQGGFGTLVEHYGERIRCFRKVLVTYVTNASGEGIEIHLESSILMSLTKFGHFTLLFMPQMSKNNPITYRFINACNQS